MLKRLFSGWLLAVAVANVAAAAPVPPSDPAAIEAYRRLPYCRLAPDGKHLAEEPCRRPPTRGFAARRTVPAPAAASSRRLPETHDPVVAPQLPDDMVRPVPAVPPSIARVTPPAAVMPPVPPPAVQPLNQCDLAGCRGANGTLYQQGAGNIVLDPSGRMCTRQGQWVHCQ
ncbi:hypothetical protein GJ700_20795 [Duganella sp. FT92W]|uniref:Uncharacterized protein n=1 Tax=Pseudoduganella rivuli TaxID=2666085 RepID=A0A7X2IQ89_9BURK|nr:hypothetical protein [Pseudoduganella rivuli]MRV74151.1 hypothetical protein [Pseudoduganella rivuli]